MIIIISHEVTAMGMTFDTVVRLAKALSEERWNAEHGYGPSDERAASLASAIVDANAAGMELPEDVRPALSLALAAEEAKCRATAAGADVYAYERAAGEARELLAKKVLGAVFKAKPRCEECKAAMDLACPPYCSTKCEKAAHNRAADRIESTFAEVGE